MAEDKALVSDLKTIWAGLPKNIVTQHDELKQIAKSNIKQEPSRPLNNEKEITYNR